MPNAPSKWGFFSVRKPIYILNLVFVALFPILFLYSNNVDQIDFNTIVRALYLTLLSSFFVFLLFALASRDFHKSLIITIVLVILFFSYGHIYGMIKNSTILGLGIGRHRFLAPLWLFILILFLGIIFWKIKNPEIVLKVLLPISIILVVSPLSNIIWFNIQTNSSNISGISIDKSSKEVQKVNKDFSSLPDIYFIIMDSYPRQDTLDEEFNFDNEPFLKELEDNGFYVARCSQSNYSLTGHSIASALNMIYLDDLGVDFEQDKTSVVPLRSLIKHSKTRQILADLGYSTIAFETGYDWSNVYDADLFLKPTTSTYDKWNLRGGLNSFELMLIKSSLGSLVADGTMVVPSFFELDLEYPNQIRREQVLFSLNELKKIPAIPGPKFVFALIIAPHSPILFNSDGTPVVDPLVNNGEAPLTLKKAAYRDQMTYLNSTLIDLLVGIIKDSKTAPIIILQADHGPSGQYTEDDIRHRMNILNAYFLPDSVVSKYLYPEISPVNSFRVLFNALLDTESLLLEDASHYSEYHLPYFYTIVDNECPSDRD